MHTYMGTLPVQLLLEPFHERDDNVEVQLIHKFLPEDSQGACFAEETCSDLPWLSCKATTASPPCSHAAAGLKSSGAFLHEDRWPQVFCSFFRHLPSTSPLELVEYEKTKFYSTVRPTDTRRCYPGSKMN
jgi:hypothetical protein